jgi:hypothetical protein
MRGKRINTCWSFDSEYEMTSAGPGRSSVSKRHRVSDHQWCATLLTKSAPHAWLPLWPDPVHPGVVILPMPRSASRSACSIKLSVVFVERCAFFSEYICGERPVDLDPVLLSSQIRECYNSYPCKYTQFRSGIWVARMELRD